MFSFFQCFSQSFRDELDYFWLIFPQVFLLKTCQKNFQVIDDHHQMWDAFQEEDWQEVLEHVETQVRYATRGGR